MKGMEESEVYTEVRGTIGYTDPEYLSTAKLTSASDMYSFGIVILQLLSGQGVTDLDWDGRDQLIRKVAFVTQTKSRCSSFHTPFQVQIEFLAKPSNYRPCGKHLSPIHSKTNRKCTRYWILKSLQANDVNMMRRPIADFQDQRMKGGVITVDFESIPQIAVLCVANSIAGRPTIELVYEELDKAYKNRLKKLV